MGVMIKSRLTICGALLVVVSQCVAGISPKFDNLQDRVKIYSIAMFSSLEVKRWTAVAFTNKLIFMELYTHISNRHTTEAYKRHWDYHRSRLKRKENISWEENQVAEGGYIEWIHIMFMLSKWDEQT